MTPSSPRSARWVRLASPAAGLAFGVVAAWQGRRVLAAASAGWGPQQAADALPLYLASQVARAGGDPTRVEALREAYQASGLAVHAQVWSTLYPASAAVLLQPLTCDGWEPFLAAWRPLVLLLFALGGAAAGAASAGRPHTVLGAGLGAWLATCAWPLLVPAVGLGQANLAVAGLSGLALAALATRLGGVAAALAAVGAGLKLVPAILAWPLLAAGRWRSLAAGLAAALLLVALTSAFVPLDAGLAGLWRTVTFQQGVLPAWAVHPADFALGVHSFAALRHLPLFLLTLVATALATRYHRLPVVRATAGALLLAWLGQDAAGVGAFYLHLAMPAAAWMLAWPLRPDAPHWSWALAGLALLPWVVAPADPYAPDAELLLGLAGLALWVGVFLRLGHRLEVPRSSHVLVASLTAGVVLLSLGSGVDRTWLRPLPPPPPDGDRQEIGPAQLPGVGVDQPVRPASP